MLKIKTFNAAVVGILALAAVSIFLVAQSDWQHTQAVSVLVTVAGKGNSAPPDVPKDAVYVHQDNQTRGVLDWDSLSQGGSNLELVVYVDDALDHSVGVQLEDVAAFIRALPPNTRVEVAYSLGGVPQVGQSFTTDREAAIRAVHIPLGRTAGSYGLYSGLSDLVKAWTSEATRREILIISDGLDFLRGRSQLLPGENPDLDALMDLLRRGNIAAFAIFANGGPAQFHDPTFVSIGQSCLEYLSDETGGEAFTGVSTAPSFKPYLDRISQDLAHQYLLTFAVSTSPKPKLSRLKVGAEVSGAVVYAPAHILVPATPASQ